MINQSAGKGIIIHEKTGGNMAGTCSSNDAIWGWDIRPDNGDEYNNAGYGPDYGLMPFSGEECVLVYHYRSFTNSTHYWSITYEIVDVNLE